MKEGIELKENQTIVFIGDSITDAGRDETAYSPLGYGYVHFAANYLLAKYPELNLRIINTGIGGNIVTDLQRRWQNDCLNYQPDIVSVLIGINDLWQTFSSGHGYAAALKNYESIYARLLFDLKQQKDCQLILIQPFMFCNDLTDKMFQGLSNYIDVVNNLANQFNAVLVPLQKAINEKIKTVEAAKWSDDMVHPSLWAHCWISQQWIEATKI